MDFEILSLSFWLKFLEVYIFWSFSWILLIPCLMLDTGLVLCCTIITRISDLEIKVTDFEILCWSFWLKFFSTFLLWKQLRQIGGWTSVSLVTLTCGSWSEGQHDPYFTVHWFCLISWRLFDIFQGHNTAAVGIEPPDLSLRSPTLYHWATALPCMIITLWHYESVWPDVWPQNKCRSLWPIFHGPVILPYISRLFDVWTSYFGTVSQ